MNFDLYSIATPSYSQGAEDSGNGIGVPNTSNLLGTWAQTGNPPAGWGPNQYTGLTDCVHHNGYFYGQVGLETAGLGRGVYRYTLNPTTMQMTYDSMVDRVDMGLNGGTMAGLKTMVYDEVEGSVLIHSYDSANRPAPIIGKWLFSNWPFSSANAEWKVLAGSYPSYSAGAIYLTSRPYLDRTAGRLYLPSAVSGVVLTVNWSTGATLGEWAYNSGGPSRELSFSILGVDSSGDVVGGSPNASGGGGNVYSWNTTNLSSWSQGTLRIPKPATTTHGYAPQWKHTKNALNFQLGGLSDGLFESEKTLLGLPSISFTQSSGFGSQGERILVTYDHVADEWQERVLCQLISTKRTGTLPAGTAPLPRAIDVGGIPWYILSSDGTIEHYDDNPLGAWYTKGVEAVFAGVGRVDLSFVPGSKLSPRKLLLDLGGTLDNEFSAHYGKVRAAIDVNGGGFSAYRSGPRQLHHLESVVDTIPAWPELQSTDNVTIRVEMSTGLLNQFAPVQGNPGAVTTPDIAISDLGPPRDLRPTLVAEPTELGGGVA